MTKIVSASGAAIIALCVAAGPAYAQNYRLMIPAQPLDRTLQAIGLTVHAEIIFPPELVAGKQAPAIDGNFTLRDALARALTNSGLTFRPAGSGYVVVARPQPEPEPTPPPPPAPTIDAGPAEAVSAADIVVTGSRVAQSGFRAPSPTAVLTAEVIDRQGATSLQSILNQSPAFKATRSPGGNSISTVSPGLATADLRGLGGQRTLVLVNGSRIVPQAPSTNLSVPVATDLNLIPTLMIERVETVTGGASAQYGSDAVSGVVNILLKRKAEGIQLTAQAGISQRNDNKSYRIGLVTGTSFADDRGHIVFSAEHDEMNGVDDLYSRDWGREEYNLVSNPNRATNGLPAFVVAPNVHNALGAAGVFLTAVRPAGAAGTGFRDALGTSLLGTTVNPDGTLRAFDGGTLSNGTLQIGGEGASPIKGAALIPVIKRNTVYGRAQFDISPSVLISIEGGYSQSKAILDGSLPRFVGVTIARDNAYLPAQIKAALALPANANVTGFTFNRIGYDIGINKFTVLNKTPHGLVGLEGDLGGSWKWDSHYSYGQNKYIQITTKQSVTANINRALAAVATPGSGVIVCADTLSANAATRAAAAGCVPINLFGEGKPSDTAINYITGNGYNTSVYGQHAAAANLRGDLFSTWAGAVSSAFGVEYRRESQTVKVDAIGAAQGFTSGGNASPFGPAHFDVKEAYFETIVPLVRDSFFHSADLNGAIRYADYSTVGGQTTWKVGAVIEPIEGLRFRGTRSRDIRAPALYELFSPGADVSNNITLLNPVTKASQNPRLPQNTTRGNANLNAEKADSFTLGVVAEPRGALRGLRLSLDYYDIDIKGAITNLSGANIATLCTQEINSTGPGRFCSFFTFTPTGVATRLDSPTLNLGSFHNIGIDGSLSYTSDLSGMGIGGRGTISLDGTYVRHAYVNTGVPGSVAIDRAGENGAANLGAVPRFRGNMSLTYAARSWSLTNQFLFISKGTNDNTYNTAPTLTINDNSVPRVIYWNLYGTLTINKMFELFGRVDNMLDKAPPVVPYAVLNQPTNGQFYDKIGRSFNLGIRVKL